MNLIAFLKNNFFLQNLAAWIVSLIPPMIEHNLQKYAALKKAFYLTALEQLEGDYLEFGVFTGSSFVFATRIHRKLQFLSKAHTRFFGFDSFSGFGKTDSHDDHPFYKDDTFRVNADRIITNIKKNAGSCETQIIRGFFEESIKGKTALSFGIQKSRIIFIDCDLKDPSEIAFEFIAPTIQKGTILVMDDYFSYKGDLKLGVAGAFEEFKIESPQYKWRRVADYGYGGAVYICCESSASV